MKYLLDTNTVSDYLRGTPATVKHIQSLKPTALVISAITAMELTYGVEKRKSAILAAAVQGFLSGVQVMPFDHDAARHAGVVRAACESIGVALSLADSQIAGHALALKLSLVSTDAAFKHVRGLTVKDWSKP